MNNQSIKVPPYFDYLIDAFDPAHSHRFVHLGHWDNPEQTHGADNFLLAQIRLNTHLLEMAKLTSGLQVLDVGCGLGGTLQNINTCYHDMVLTGVNIDPRQLNICAQLSPENNNTLSWREADASTLPFADNSFDRVLCIEAMFHFSSRKAFFKEVARVLKPGGIFVASDMIFSPTLRELPTPGFMIEAPLQDGYGPWPDFWGEEDDHKALAAQTDMTCVEYRDVSRATLPSHKFTTPSGADLLRDSGVAAIRASLALRWLHERDFLKYYYMCFSA